MTKEERNGIKALSDMVYEYYKNFLNNGIEPITAGQMASNIVLGLMELNAKQTQDALKSVWGIYGGKAD